MAVSIETILADAQKLVFRLKEHDNSADCLIVHTQSLQKQLDAMKQFQEHLSELNEVGRHRPRLGLIITLAQENSKIRELQSENVELRQSLNDHQSALEVIMTKYREQLANLHRANQVERSLLQRSANQHEDIRRKSEKILEMKVVMWQAANTDEQTDCKSVIAALQRENEMMRELLQLEISDTPFAPNAAATHHPDSTDAAIQTQTFSDNDPFCGDFPTMRPKPTPSVTDPPAASCAPNSENPKSSQNPAKKDLCTESDAEVSAGPLNSAPEVTSLVETSSASPINCNDSTSDTEDLSGSNTTLASATDLDTSSSDEVPCTNNCDSSVQPKIPSDPQLPVFQEHL